MPSYLVLQRSNMVYYILHTLQRQGQMSFKKMLVEGQMSAFRVRPSISHHGGVSRSTEPYLFARHSLAIVSTRTGGAAVHCAARNDTG
jgi:hypothetical protein